MLIAIVIVAIVVIAVIVVIGKHFLSRGIQYKAKKMTLPEICTMGE